MKPNCLRLQHWKPKSLRMQRWHPAQTKGRRVLPVGQIETAAALEEAFLAKCSRVAKEAELSTLAELATVHWHRLFLLCVQDFRPSIGTMQRTGYRSLEGFSSAARTRNSELGCTIPVNYALGCEGPSG